MIRSDGFVADHRGITFGRITNLLGRTVINAAILKPNRLRSSVQSSGKTWGRNDTAGIQYVTGKEGRKAAIQIDLREHASLREKFEDVLVSEPRQNEESIPLEQVEAKLAK
jgi:hypothetical protein